MAPETAHSADISVLRPQKMDPQMRKLLEVTHEAFVDSGVDYKSLRGSSRVGVYLGCCGSEVHAMWLSDYNNITGYEQTGCTLSMFANRLSFFFDFKGPSKAVDTGAPQPSSLFGDDDTLPKTYPCSMTCDVSGSTVLNAWMCAFPREKQQAAGPFWVPVRKAGCCVCGWCIDVLCMWACESCCLTVSIPAPAKD